MSYSKKNKVDFGPITLDIRPGGESVDCYEYQKNYETKFEYLIDFIEKKNYRSSNALELFDQAESSINLDENIFLMEKQFFKILSENNCFKNFKADLIVGQADLPNIFLHIVSEADRLVFTVSSNDDFMIDKIEHFKDDILRELSSQLKRVIEMQFLKYKH